MYAETQADLRLLFSYMYIVLATKCKLIFKWVQHRLLNANTRG